jgi:hypothetical protein
MRHKIDDYVSRQLSSSRISFLTQITLTYYPGGGRRCKRFGSRKETTVTLKSIIKLSKFP